MNDVDMQLEQAMRAFVAAYTSGTLTHIPTFVKQFPEAMRPELLDFIEEYLVMEAEPEQADMPVDALVRAKTAIIEVLREAVAPAPTLTALRKQRMLLPSKLARDVRLPADFFGLLERGEIRLLTIPAKQARLLVERLAQALSHTADEIWLSLRAPVQTAPIRMSAQDAATLHTNAQLDFREALLQSAELTPEMRAEWLDEVEGAV